MFDELKDYKIMDWAKLLLVIGLVVSIGLFSVNQYVAFRYKAVFLTTPCDLCLELNDNVDLCPRGMYNNNLIIEPEYPNASEVLSDLFVAREVSG